MKKEERDELARRNIYLVRSCARRYSTYSHLPFADLVGEGCVGLLYAIDKFKPNYRKKNGKKVKFSTYAYWWIRRFILRAMEREKVVTVSANISQLTSRWKKEAQLLTEELGRMPEDQEIAKTMKINSKKVKNVKKSLVLKELSLDLSVGERRLLDLIGGATEKSFDAFKNKELLRGLFQSLNKKEQEILKLHFGLDGRIPLTLAKIGEKFHLTRQRIHQIVKIAIKKVRKRLDNEKDKGFYSHHP